jgi:glycosyltransferase involved in cell wall biosynthesis
LRIILVLSKAPIYSETFLTSKIRGLEKNGHEVVLCVDTKSSEDKAYDRVYALKSTGYFHKLSLLQGLMELFIFRPGRAIRFLQFERKSGMSIGTALKNMTISSHILKRDAEILHFGFSTLAKNRENVAKAMGIPMGVSIRGYDTSIYPLKHKNSHKMIWEQMTRLHYLSDDLLKDAIYHGFNPEIAHQKITPALNPDLFRVRKQLIEKNTLQLITVARLNWKKGIMYAIKAAKMLMDSGIKFHYQIIGSGEDEARLKYITRIWCLHERITFRGKLSHNQTIEEIQKADIFIMPSVQEGFCNAVLEAQASGCLCVVSDAQGLAENVLHERTGWVVPRRNARAIHNKVLEINKMSISDKQVIVNNAKDRIERQYTLDIQDASWLEFFESMLKSTPLKNPDLIKEGF